MAREDILVHERIQNFPIKESVVETTAYDAVKDTILTTLREMFAKHPEYTYVPDPHRGFGFPDLDKTKISIWQNYPYDTLFLPCITLNLGSQRSKPLSFNQNLGTVDYLLDKQGNQVFDSFGRPIPIYYEYADAWDISLNININAQSPWDRDIITDYLTINLTHVYRDYLYTRGIFVSSVSTSGESEADWKNQQIYKLTVSAELYTEWTHRIPYPTETIDRIGLKIGMPISSEALVPSEGIVNGFSVETVAGILSPSERQYRYFNDQKPATASETIKYNTTTNVYEITPQWWEMIGRVYHTPAILAMIHSKYNITSLSQLTVFDWMDSISSISSSIRLGYLKTIQDLKDQLVQVANRLGIDPNIPLDVSYGNTYYNEALELQFLIQSLTTNYNHLVIRPEGI